MTKVLVLYYSAYGHVEAMAQAVTEGARGAAGVDLRRAPETVPAEMAVANGFKRDQAAAVASVEELANYDAIIVGAGTRFGRVPAQMANFWDQTGGLWAKGALIGKIGACFTATGTQHGGQETTLLSIITTFLHHGMVVAGLPYSYAAQMQIGEVSGGAPYGATTITGADGSRQPSKIDLDGARFLGAHVANIARRLTIAKT